MLSEYANLATLACTKCGGALSTSPAAKEVTAPDASRLRLKRDTRPPPPPPGEEQAEEEPVPKVRAPGDPMPSDSTFAQLISHNRPAPRQKTSSKHIMSWVMFIVLGGTMGFLRYGNILTTDQLDLAARYGPFVLLALHVVIILMAFKDSVFQGILCLLIPGYTLYYVLLLSDSFYMRALTAALLIGLGQDSALYYKDVATETFEAVSAWIESGGGDVR